MTNTGMVNIRKIFLKSLFTMYESVEEKINNS